MSANLVVLLKFLLSHSVYFWDQYLISVLYWKQPKYCFWLELKMVYCLKIKTKVMANLICSRTIKSNRNSMCTETLGFHQKTKSCFSFLKHLAVVSRPDYGKRKMITKDCTKKAKTELKGCLTYREFLNKIDSIRFCLKTWL